MLKVSVIIPYFRKKNYIKKTLLSILKQTFKKFEVLIIYDDSEKSDLTFIKTLLKLDRRIKLIINKKNLGAGLSRNIGILKAKGKYISFIDADDIWNKNKLRLQIKFMENNNYQISHTSYVIANMKNKVLEFRKARNFTKLKDLLYSCDIGLSTVMIKKSVFSNKLKFPKLKTKEDFVLWLNLVKSGYKIYSLDRNLVKWTKTNNSLSSSIFQKLIDSFNVYHNYMQFNFFKSIYFTLALSINFIKKKYL